MAEAAIYYPNICGKKFVAYNAGTSGAVGKKPFGWSLGGNIQFTWAAPACVASPTLYVDSGTGNIQITSTSITNYPGLTATSSYYGKVTVNYKNIGGTFCKAPVFSFFYKGIFSNAIANGGPTSTLSTTLANQTGTTTWQFGREQTGVDCSTTHGAKNTQIEVGITPTTSSHSILPVTVQCP